MRIGFSKTDFILTMDTQLNTVLLWVLGVHQHPSLVGVYFTAQSALGHLPPQVRVVNIEPAPYTVPSR